MRRDRAGEVGTGECPGDSTPRARRVERAGEVIMHEMSVEMGLSSIGGEEGRGQARREGVSSEAANRANRAMRGAR